jgi:hypothetical protein
MFILPHVDYNFNSFKEMFVHINKWKFIFIFG